MSGTYTEEELSKLSQTERDALTATGEEDEGVLADIAGDDSDVDDPDGDNNNDEGEGSDESTDSDDTGVGEGEGSDEDQESTTTPVAPGEIIVDDIPPVLFVPSLSGEVLPQFQAEIDRVSVSKQSELAELDAKLDEGELTASAHRTQTRAIESEIRAATRKLEAASQNTEISDQLWQAEQKAFFGANQGYTQKSNPVLWGALNQEVLRVANDPSNSGLTGIQTLCTAKANVEKAFKAMFPGTAPAEDKPKVNDKSKIPPKPAAKRPNHQTLRDVPAADSADVGQDRFAHLDKLSGLGLESAIANMSDADKKAYLEGA